jgi:hypothetical protein
VSEPSGAAGGELDHLVPAIAEASPEERMLRANWLGARAGV